VARTHGQGNPKWTRDETILALDLYVDCEGRPPSDQDSRVKGLSELLQRLPHHPSSSRTSSFRNPAGVAFKLQNLHQVATGNGLENVSAMDRLVWADLCTDPERIKQIANSIRKLAQGPPEELTDTGDDEEFAEGRLLTALHKRRERNPHLRCRLLQARRLQARTRMGRLTCDLCGQASPFQESQGDDDAIFEVHHLVSIAVAGERSTRIQDLALLCANCHRALHRAITRARRWLSLAEVAAMFGIPR
jgi:5-methylcytosine-specific restriction protein A